tara:strand:- start:3222 stop:4235 length:1014 start_codon:yes stop_codon:yes gene_type:complete
MASKQYAYYMRGNKLALVQVDDIDNTSDDYGKFKSPTVSATEGLELQYTYAPTYELGAPEQLQDTSFYINGWTVVDGYLTFCRGHIDGATDWTSSPYSNVANDEYVHISGSNRWNGIHQIQTRYNNGLLKTYTKVKNAVQQVVGTSAFDIKGEGTGGASANQFLIVANDNSNIWLNSLFSPGDYIFIIESTTAKNNGFWEVDAVQADSSIESTSGIFMTNLYYCYKGENTLTTEGIDSTPDTTASDNETLIIYRAYRDFCLMRSGVNVLNDEDDVLDITPYQAKALVYYLKARIAEDTGDMKLREYFIKEFNEQLNKSNNSRVHGIRRVVSPRISVK